MGWTVTRTDGKGNERYTACYRDLRGQQHSAGTFTTPKAADRAWQRAEAKLAEGRLGDPRRGRQTFRRYVEDEWLPNHEMEIRTRENYTYYLNRRILPWFGPMRMIEVLPVDVREWINHLKGSDISPSVIRYCLTILSAIFTTALNDQITQLHPCRGVRTPPVMKPIRAIITPEQFDQICSALPSEAMRLLIETNIETGLRWGELTELRVKDINHANRILTVTRVAVELVPKFHPAGGRFLVKEYPKDREHRRLSLSSHLVDKLAAWVAENDLRDDDLLFPMPEQSSQPRIDRKSVV